MEIRCKSVQREPEETQSFLSALLQSRRELRHSTRRAASITTSNELFNEVARRSISDLYMLLTNTVHGPYPYAGIPWFSTVFGRDALITALQTLWLDPEIARGVLQYLAAMQAKTVDPQADDEPGKILHEMRHGEMARLGEVPFGLYYGSVDATPLFDPGRAGRARDPQAGHAVELTHSFFASRAKELPRRRSCNDGPVRTGATNGAGMVIAHAMHSTVLRQGAQHAKPTSHQ